MIYNLKRAHVTDSSSSVTVGIELILANERLQYIYCIIIKPSP